MVISMILEMENGDPDDWTPNLTYYHIIIIIKGETPLLVRSYRYSTRSLKLNEAVRVGA